MSREERFWAKAEIGESDECWLWKAALHKDGYGMFGYGHGRKGSGLAHRFAYEFSVGEIPEGMCVLHRCDNPPCVNPSHLFLGTQADNVADCARKGRRNQSRVIKLTEEQREDIRIAYEWGFGSQSQLAKLYGVSQPTVSYIVRGRP